MPPITNKISTQPKTAFKRKLTHNWGYLGLILVLAIGAWSLTHLETIRDWYILAGYHPPQLIARMAQEDTMTAYGRELLYVNRPQVESKTGFASHCHNGSDHAYVVGCYHSGDNGIFLLKINVPDLNGIEPVTAAYEMLHAAYARIGNSTKTVMDKQMWQFYQAHVTNQIIRSQMSVYAATEPGESYDELFSVLGTEVGNLPSDLANYYRPYFTNRSAIIAMYDHYQAAFTSRINTINQDDSILSGLKSTIDVQETQLASLSSSISSIAGTLHQDFADGQIVNYNSTVDTYNNQVSQYDALVNQVKAEVNQYNTLANARNSLALQEQNLISAINANALPNHLK